MRISDQTVPPTLSGTPSDRRKGYRYPRLRFSADGTRIAEGRIVYRQVPFPAPARRAFRLWLASVLLMAFPGMPLLAAAGWHDRLGWILVPVLVLLYAWHGRIHACPCCGHRSRVVKVPRMGAPVLYLCRDCHTFFEHGHVHGGLPWK